jgi:hypothetical protein|tara:strand:- start:259 stop:444 length:186 start_codon:yes stop_codon:yes gene_type:complete
MIHKFFLKKKIARRFINLGVPLAEACEFADAMDDTKSVLIIRDSKTFKPDIIILIKTKHYG